MVYKKTTIISLVLAIFFGIVSGVVFGATDVAGQDQIFSKGLEVLIFVQKYSWPVIILALIYALYQFYVIGSENLEKKVLGQRLIVGIAIFTAFIQALPLCYVFIITIQAA